MKLIEINKNFKILKKGIQILELGASPGGWTQVLKKYLGTKGKIIALDIDDFTPLNKITACNANIIAAIVEDIIPKSMFVILYYSLWVYNEYLFLTYLYKHFYIK